MSLPIVIIFERHWDTMPKSVIKDLLPELSERGYGTFCFEAPQNLSSAEILERHNHGLKEDSRLQKQAETLLKQQGITSQLSQTSFSILADQMRSYVSSKHYLIVAEKIKQLPASRMLKEVFDEAEARSISLKGIDINSRVFDQMVAPDLSQRGEGLSREMDHRNTTMFQNLLTLHSEQEDGIIFACGASHAKGLIDLFKKHSLQDQVLYYFPHSSDRYDESQNDIDQITRAMGDTLVGHTYLLEEKDIKGFGNAVVKEITAKNYTEITDRNSHADTLSECFKTRFRPFLRARCQVDALVEITEQADIKNIRERLLKVGISTHDICLSSRSYLVVPNVNKPDVAERIRRQGL
jgi:hypothetical protein